MTDQEFVENANIITVKRKDILKTIFFPLEKIKEIEMDLFDLLFEQYPFVKQTLA